MQKYIFIAWIVSQSAWVGAQPAYGPGTFKLTPKRRRRCSRSACRFLQSLIICLET